MTVRQSYHFTLDSAAQITEHRYDVLGNRTQTILPTGEILNRLYYGSGHLHHINLDGTTLADIERDALHRPIERTIGKLNTQFQLDPLGRLKQQIAQPNSTVTTKQILPSLSAAVTNTTLPATSSVPTTKPTAAGITPMMHWAELPKARTSTTATTLHITLPTEAESAATALPNTKVPVTAMTHWVT